MVISNERWQDNWRKTNSTTDTIREQGEAASKRDADQAGKVAERLNSLSVPVSAKDPRAAKSDSTPVKSGRDLPQAEQGARAETQDQATRSSTQASERYLDAQKDAKGLKYLEAKAPPTKSGDEVATKAAVVGKGEANQAEVGKRGTSQSVTTFAELAKRNALGIAAKKEGKEKAADESRAPDKSGNEGAKDKKLDNATKDLSAFKPADKADAGRDVKALAQSGKAVISGNEGASKADKSERGEAKEKKGADKKKGGDSKQASGVYARPSNSGGELNALLGGFSGDSGSGQGGAEANVVPADTTKVDDKGKLPETDPTFHVYSEFDSENPGVELIKSKSQIFDRLVVKQKLVEIAKLDQELDGKIRGLSERIVGDLKSELNITKFLGSVYGGVIG